MESASEPVRVDKWLWAARIVKTRALAVDAIRGGRVEINGGRVKPSRDVHVGDRLEIALGQSRLELVVRGTSARRGPASEAALLYEETTESRQAREQRAAEGRLAGLAGPVTGARPTKRDRRRYEATAGRRRPREG